MKKANYLILAIAALGIGFSASWYINNSKPVRLEAGVWFGEQARQLPLFELYDQDSNVITRQQLAGKWTLMFFGYTNCPDICPATMQTMADMMKNINDADVSKAIRVIFVSIDPDRDTPETLKAYVSYFDAGFIGATAALEKLRLLTRALGISHEIRKTSDVSAVYDVSHSSGIVLLNPAVEFAGLFSAPHNGVMMAQDLTNLIERY